MASQPPNTMPEVLSFAQIQTIDPPPVRILTTKLFAPRARAQRVARPRLTQQLTAGLHHKLTLISAPAGFGKTTVLSEWREVSAKEAVSIAWVSLDKNDNDLTRFLAYVIAALQTIQPDLGKHAQALLSAAPVASEAVLVSLINDLAAFNGEVAILLDDAHVIEAQAVHEAIEFLLENLPPHAHLIIASRTEPPLALARLRARNQLTELHAAELRFTPDEAADFLRRVMKLVLPATELAALIEHTEGWAAGLQLTALSLQHPTDRSRPPGPVTGSDRYILDYLVEEVLQRQTEDVQTFLLQTSILERLTGPLCDAVVDHDTTRANGQAMLELLERLNLFVVPLDAQRQWYRYHHLFAELLRDRLQHWQPERVTDLHQRASAWFAAHTLPREALQHALTAGDCERAAELIEPLVRDGLYRNEIAALHRWLSAVPRTRLVELRDYLWTKGESLALQQLDRLLAVDVLPNETVTPDSPALLEPLNEREMDVLRLIADGRSNHDIARELIVAVSTVKWHINNLYAKLNVHSRTLAIARARELGILQAMHSVGSYQSRSL